MSRFTRREFVGSSAALPLGLGLAAGASAGAPKVQTTGAASMIVTGANVITMDGGNPRAEALAVRGDRLLAVGSDDNVMQHAGTGTRRIDARGLTVTPGFIDAHSHPLFAEEAVGVNVNLPRIGDVKRALAAKAAQTPPGHWIRGVMYDDTKFEDARPLDRRDLDDAVPDHPVYVGHRGGHTGVVNSKAFELAGITNRTPDPDDGRYFRENGELTGKVAEHARDVFFEVGTWPVIDRAVRQRAAEIASRNMAAAGLTIDDGRLRHPGRPDRLPGCARCGRTPLSPVIHARRR